MAASMRRTTASGFRCGSNPMAPQIPHMASARGIQEGAAGTAQLRAQMHARDAEAVFTEPAQRYPQQQQENNQENRGDRSGERFALDQQRHGGGFIPTRQEAIQNSTQREPEKMNAADAYVHGAVESVIGIVGVDAASSFRKNDRIGELFAGQRISVSIAQDATIGRIHDDPAAVY